MVREELTDPRSVKTNVPDQKIGPARVVALPQDIERRVLQAQETTSLRWGDKREWLGSGHGVHNPEVAVLSALSNVPRIDT